MLCGLCQDIEQKGRRAFRGQAAGVGFGEKTPREIIDEPKDLLDLPLPAGGDGELVSPGRPGVAQGAPVGKAGFITKEQHRLALACLPQHRGPRLVVPLQAGSASR